MATNDDGVSHCYVFKSQLQQYAQKVGHSTPVYETIKEGPSHEPFFRSTVIVNEVRYDSLPGFYNRKTAEQSAAEVALVELAKLGVTDDNVSQPVQETGLCKNVLQEYAQKMNHATPLYDCQEAARKQDRDAFFTCTVEVGCIRYIGGKARSKKEAEIKAARTALLAIRSLANEPNEKSTLTVIPSKRKEVDRNTNSKPAPQSLKAKKGQFKAKRRKRVNGNRAVLKVNEQDQKGSSIPKMPVTVGDLNPHCDYASQNGQQHPAFTQNHNGTTMNELSKKEDLDKYYAMEQEVRLADDPTLVRVGMLQV